MLHRPEPERVPDEGRRQEAVHLVPRVPLRGLPHVGLLYLPGVRHFDVDGPATDDPHRFHDNKVEELQDILQGVSKLDYLLKVSIFQIQKKKALPAVAQSVRPKSNMHSFAFDGDSQFDELSSDGESEFDRRASTIVYYDDEAIEKLDYRVSRAVGGSYANGEFERLRKTAT
eukprot:CAMPEP_0170503168 /NCGR_PEP_ID=MMETSP0208-20121228/43846_1 /TAXON_ID=197538 /ORGANISM="Strombidium inclinatum, Strain S3" /LENGTH=171 /DNA_ID=CAMNT_0010782681 /DNA_START=1050 /DNA_END=1563 /DNA_ORIENTATION=-